MSSSTHGNQDQRNSNSIEDPTMANNGTEDPNMTIEFLRARLLSERSVSRAARQRADELAKRVVELEEQLKIVSLQRKKAEKATANVLAILENHGISDASEEFDSSSEQDETITVSNDGKDLGNGEETSTSIRTPAYSSSEIESSPSTGRSLSWENSKHSRNSFEQKKYMNSARRKFTSSASNGSLPKRMGKSCRRIRHREIRSAVEGLQKDSSNFCFEASTACPEGVPNDSGSQPRISKDGSCHPLERDPVEVPVSRVSPNQSQVTDGHFFSGNLGYQDIEGALKHQEQLIGRFEAEEKAQREWEEKFAENYIRSPDSCDPGNHSDVTEERDDTKTTGQPRVAPVISAAVQDVKSEGANICPNGDVKMLKNLSPRPEVGTSLQEQEFSSKIAREPLVPDNGISLSGGIHHQLQPESHNRTSSSHHQFAVSSCVDNSSQNSTSSGNTHQVASVAHETTDSVGSVLEALQQVKLSLKQKLDGAKLVESVSSGMAIKSSIPAIGTGDELEIPPGCPGLFRLPDMRFGTTSRANWLSVTALQSSFPSYYPEDTGQKCYSTLYMEPKSSISSSKQFRSISASSAESISVAHLKQSSYEPPTVEQGLPSFTRFLHPDFLGSNDLPSTSKLVFPSYPSFPDITPRLPFNGRFTATHDNKNVGVHSASHSPLHDDHRSLVAPQTRLPVYDDLKVGLPPSTRLSFYDHDKPDFFR